MVLAIVLIILAGLTLVGWLAWVEYLREKAAYSGE